MIHDTPHTTMNERRRFVLAALALGVLALLPRVLHLGGFVTLDEINFWMQRSERFLNALASSDPAATAIRPHPGVTTMWLGSGGILLRRALVAWEILPSVPFPLLLALMRLPVVLVHTAGVVVGFWLLWKLLPRPAALLAGVFWAADPFVIGYSRLLHVDALLATFATLSLLALCVYAFRTPHTGYLLLSGACAALAVLSKTPGLALLPIAGLLLLLRRPFSLLYSAFSIILWGGAFGLTFVLVWPAVWADPLRVLALLGESVTGEGAQPHGWGNYFLGRPTEAPGLLFYPATLALRLTPITLVGVLLLPVGWRRLDARTRRSLLVLLAFVLLFTLAMSLFPKKFNRYLVPVFPALDILAAVGISLIMHYASLIAHRFSRIAQRFPFSLLPSPFSLLVLLAVLNAAHWHPYPIAAFNQALGGTRAGAQTFLVGWGEGLGQVADWLNQQPDSTDVTIASQMVNTLQPYLRHGAQAIAPYGDTLPATTGYAVVAIRDMQRQGVVPALQAVRRSGPLLHTVTLHGVPYAHIYQVPPPVAQPAEAVFGESLALRGYTLDMAQFDITGVLSVTLQWQAQTTPAQDYMLFLHLLDDDGQRVAQADTPPAGSAAPTSTWQPVRVRTWTHPLPLPPDLPAGDYWLALGLYDPADFARLPVANGQPPPGAPDAGGNALLLPVGIPERQ